MLDEDEPEPVQVKIDDVAIPAKTEDVTLPSEDISDEKTTEIIVEPPIETEPEIVAAEETEKEKIEETEISVTLENAESVTETAEPQSENDTTTDTAAGDISNTDNVDTNTAKEELPLPQEEKTQEEIQQDVQPPAVEKTVEDEKIKPVMPVFDKPPVLSERAREILKRSRKKRKGGDDDDDSDILQPELFI
jgi:hypothetical protein